MVGAEKLFSIEVNEHLREQLRCGVEVPDYGVRVPHLRIWQEEVLRIDREFRPASDSSAASRPRRVRRSFDREARPLRRVDLERIDFLPARRALRHRKLSSVPPSAR